MTLTTQKTLARGVALAALLTGFAAAGTAQAAPVASMGPAPSSYQIEARGRNGNTGFEGVLFTPGDPFPGTAATQLDPGGAPVWQYNTYYDFTFTYTFATGTATWGIDFNKDNDYLDSEEFTTSTSPTLVGKSFEYVNLFGQGNTTSDGSGEVDIIVNNYVLNGTTFVPPVLTTAGTNPDSFNVLAEDTSGLFGNIVATGSFTFTGNGGQERPRLWVQLGTPQAVVPIPAALPMLGAAVAGLGLAGWRRRRAAV
jgi:hypothetical protein